MGEERHGQQQEIQNDGRRSFIKLGAAAGVGLAVGGSLLEGCAASMSHGLSPEGATLLAAPPMDTVRIGYVGVGFMGSVHMRNLVTIPGVEIKAICDIVPEHAERAAGYVTAAGMPKPTLYTRGDEDFKRMIDEQELDLVYTATPWRWHVPVSLYAMQNGKHAATEVPAATNLDDAWALVETAEKYRKHCVMMENCNYDRPEMLIWNMIRHRVFGEVVHGECGYMHDLRAIKLGDDSEGLWRWKHSIDENGNNYPTHGLGPMAQYMDINRGDAFDSLVSMSSPPLGLNEWAQEHLPADDPRRRLHFNLGDVNSSLIKTKKGKTILVQHDTNLPRPYSRINKVQGTRGIFQGYPDTIIYIEGRSPNDAWEPMDNFAAEYEHPLWRDLGGEGKGLGHGSMDYMEDYRLIQCLREGKPTDMTVYDAAAISAVAPLSKWSVNNNSRPIDFPDFTRGKWKVWPKVPIVGASV